jgi:diacylglycerol kinase family enzyme
MTFPVDLGEVLVDGRLHFFVAHLAARNRLWTRAFVVMNAQWLGGLNLGPRAHPNDGLLDVYDARLGLADVLKVRARARAGAHLPHPGIKERRVPAAQVGFDRPLTVWLDGMRVGPARGLSVRVDPDALTVVV